MEPKLMIDISSLNGNVDMTAVKNNGIDAVMIRLLYANGDACYEDKKWKLFYEDAKKVGLDVGFYVGLPSDVKLMSDTIVSQIVNLILNVPFEYPLMLDVELQSEKDRTATTKAVLSMLQELEKCGYYVGIYTSSYYLNRLLIQDELKAYDKWIAAWNNSNQKPNIGESYGMWQYTDKGTIPGVLKVVDMSWVYYDYPYLTKKLGLNHNTQTAQSKCEFCKELYEKLKGVYGHDN